jgi:hypothetical protein
MHAQNHWELPTGVRPIDVSLEADTIYNRDTHPSVNTNVVLTRREPPIQPERHK